MKYASIDIETTGLDPNWCQILEIAIVIDDLDSLTPDPNPPTFHKYLQHDRIQGNPMALVMNADILKILADNKHPDIAKPAFDGSHQQLAIEINNFLYQHCDTDKPTAAGKNFQGFDKPFLDKLFNPQLKFHHRCFEPTTSFYRKGDKTLPDLTTCLERANITLPFKLHTAVDDAKAVIALLRHIHGAK